MANIFDKVTNFLNGTDEETETEEYFEKEQKEEADFSVKKGKVVSFSWNKTYRNPSSVS